MLAQLLNAPAFREAALKAVTDQRGLLMDYLAECGFVADTGAGVVI